MSKKSALPLEQLDLESRKNLVRITALHPHEMNVHDRAFMRARVDYLTSDQVADYVENDTLPALEEEAPAAGKYDAMTVPQLKEVMTERGVEAEGTKKADLIAALEADDAEEETEE